MGSKLTFVTIGYIEWRKGQDILIEAIEHLSEDVLSRAEFILIGQNTSLMAKELKKRVEKRSNVKMAGTVSREEVHAVLENADVMICPSREDPMPTVCAEAMMHSVPCLVSDATGTAEYIKDGYNGLIFKSEDTKNLREKIEWCIQNRSVLKDMGKRAFEIYRNTFSQEAFESNLLKYVEEMIGKAE